MELGERESAVRLQADLVVEGEGDPGRARIRVAEEDEPRATGRGGHRAGESPGGGEAGHTSPDRGVQEMPAGARVIVHGCLVKHACERVVSAKIAAIRGFRVMSSAQKTIDSLVDNITKW